MSPEDQEITRRIVIDVIAEMRKVQENDEFFINRRDFYDNYKKSQRFFNFIDDASAFIGRSVLYALFIAIIGLLSISSGKLPWK